MTKNLEKADTIVKLTLAVTVIVFYSTRIISGQFATVLAILAFVTIMIFVARLLYNRRRATKHKP
jgi:hypothetical protein